MSHRMLSTVGCVALAAGCVLMNAQRGCAQGEAKFHAVTQFKTTYVKIVNPGGLVDLKRLPRKTYRFRFEATFKGKTVVYKEGAFSPAKDGSPYRESVEFPVIVDGFGPSQRFGFTVKYATFVISETSQEGPIGRDIQSFKIDLPFDQPKTDLAVSLMGQKGSRMTAKVTSPAGHGPRIYHFYRMEGKTEVPLETGELPSMFSETVEVFTDLSKLLGKQPIYLRLDKSTLDPDAKNDVRSAIYDSGKAIATGQTNPKGNQNFDLVAYDIRLQGGKLIGVIANRGPGNFPGGGYYDLRTSPTVGTKGKIPAIPATKTAEVAMALPAGLKVPASAYATLSLFGHNDAIPSNNSLRSEVGSAVSGPVVVSPKGADLQIRIEGGSGTTWKARVVNVGDANSGPGREVIFYHKAKTATNWEKTVPSGSRLSPLSARGGDATIIVRIPSNTYLLRAEITEAINDDRRNEMHQRVIGK